MAKDSALRHYSSLTSPASTPSFGGAFGEALVLLSGHVLAHCCRAADDPQALWPEAFNAEAEPQQWWESSPAGLGLTKPFPVTLASAATAPA